MVVSLVTPYEKPNPLRELQLNREVRCARCGRYVKVRNAICTEAGVWYGPDCWRLALRASSPRSSSGLPSRGITH